MSVSAAAQAPAPASPTGSPGPVRPPWLWPIRLVGSMVVVVLLALGTLSVVTRFFQRTATTSWRITEGVQRIVVDSAAGDITVRTRPAGSPVLVSVERTHAFTEPRLTREVVDGTLLIKSACDERWRPGDSCRTDLDILAPAGTVLDLSTPLGAVTVDGATAAVRASSVTGEVRITHQSGEEVEAATETGEITVDFEAPPRSVRARTTTGSIRVSVPDDGAAYRVLASSQGSPRIEVPQSSTSSSVISLTTVTGGIEVVHDT